LTLQLSAQIDQEIKPSTLVFHIFYDDFNTAQQISTSSLKTVLDNGKWSKISDMQMGLGFNYLKGISRNIDIIATIDGSYTDYLFKNGITNGSSEFLFDANIGLNLKLLSDHHSVVPYLLSGAGVSSYKGKTGYYIPVGTGLQFNLANAAFVFTNIQYRIALSSVVNDHFYYTIGVGTSIAKKKKTKSPVTETKATVKVSPPIEVVTAPIETKLPVKNLMISVTDDQTGLPLPSVEVVINGPNEKIKGFTDVNGQVIFNDIQAADYTVNGMLHGINTTTQNIVKNNFEGSGKEIAVSLSQHDPRFTLSGGVNNKSTGKYEGDVTVSVINNTQGSSINQQSQLNDGSFNIPLDAASDFTISGKKAGYISNIEKITTKGLNRSTTLYVKLELEIEEAQLGKTITLRNIYYDIGSFKIRSDASSDLEKLVKFLNDNPDFKIEIASHTDSRGNSAKNLILSQARAQEVVNYLQKNGINKNRLVPKGYGETRLVNGCSKGVKCTEEQHQQNRRTEFKVISN
jgi:outer membrane protein OmpA-like peptidoglycan-associated protein